MNILMVTSEAVPFAKTGGLADVSSALSLALSQAGHDVALILPAFRHVRRSTIPIEPTGIAFDVPIGNRLVPAELLRATFPDSRVTAYFVDQPEYFDRAQLYRENGEDYPDNCERFTFFARAVFEAIRLLELPVDVIHCNDWQAGLIPAYLAIEYRHSRLYHSIATVLTIHNLAYQGLFPASDMSLTGLDPKYFNWRQMEFWGKLGMLKTGLIFADALTTVSPRYAEEIQSSETGCGLDGVLLERREHLTGILNGVDYGIWNPATDGHLAERYDETNWTVGKARCKAALQRELGLPESPRSPIIGLVGRLDPQKGWDLVGEILPRWAENEDVQWAILGTGEFSLERLLSELVERYPNRVAARLSFSEGLAHRIEAGSDLFLMPSRYEPCGLNQMYSLKYGTVPVVRDTGGLADTICDATPDNLASHAANGFSFKAYESSALEEGLRRAIECYRHEPATWRRLVETGMGQDWSWGRSAREYSALYERIVADKRAANHAN